MMSQWWCNYRIVISLALNTMSWYYNYYQEVDNCPPFHGRDCGGSTLLLWGEDETNTK